ncbi:MAG: coproporphyrinogen III oxidase [Rickettsiales bacterium]|nr:coproporphyrinogen III oxidase [Rickettsiales bacterium]
MVAIYIHYPFCLAKCPYCDFNSHVQKNIDDFRFLCAYEKELDFFKDKIGEKKVETIFFGGGTPSLMPIFLVEGILSKIGRIFDVDENAEVTLEANPTSFESKKFKDLRKIGINRLSLGIQSLHDEDLKFLGREHSTSEAILAIEEARNIFDNFSFDLIYARPKQTLDDWEKELKRAIDFGISHLSLYQLTIEKGTQFYSRFHKGDFLMPENELAADFYELTNEMTAKNGLLNYEISNYAKIGKECRHNMAYWQGVDYVGIGAGAHSRVYFEGEEKRKAIMMIHKPQNWLELAEEKGCGIQKMNDLNKNDVLEELVLTGLRTSSGLGLKVLKRHCVMDSLGDVFDMAGLNKMCDKGIITIDDNTIRVTKECRGVSDSVIEKVLNLIIA